MAKPSRSRTWTGNRDGDQLSALVPGHPAGTRVPIAFYRDRREERVNATIEELQLDDDERSSSADAGGGTGFGLSLDDVTLDVARDLRLRPGADGALVVDVEPTSAAADAGVRRGDIILEVNHERVHSAGDAGRLLRRVRAGQVVFLLVSDKATRCFSRCARNRVDDGAQQTPAQIRSRSKWLRMSA